MHPKDKYDFLKRILPFKGILIRVGLKTMPQKLKNRLLYLGSIKTLISYEQEIALGEMIVKHLLLSEHIHNLKNKTLDSILWEIGSRLSRETGPFEYDYQIQTLDLLDIHAFILHGERISNTREFLSFLDSPKQTASVLAHEKGYVEKRHTVSLLVKEFGKVFFGDLYQTSLITTFDCPQEIEADRYALSLLEQAKISPFSLAFFPKLNRENRSYNENIEFIMTHPNNNFWIKRALNYKTQKGFEAAPFEME